MPYLGADELKDAESDSFVNIPPFYGNGNQQTTDDQELHFVEVGLEVKDVCTK